MNRPISRPCWNAESCLPVRLLKAHHSAVVAEITLEKLLGLLVSSEALTLISLLCSLLLFAWALANDGGGVAEVRGYVTPFFGRGCSKSNDVL